MTSFVASELRPGRSRVRPIVAAAVVATVACLALVLVASHAVDHKNDYS
jgi:hypothetical protein